MNEQLLALLGEFPRKPDSLDVKILREDVLPGYRRQLISYRVEQDERIKAYLLWPSATTRRKDGGFPAVLAIHPHGEEYPFGKSEVAGLRVQKTNMQYGLELVERGYVIIVPDQLGFEERRPPEWQAVDNVSVRNEKYERLVYFERLLQGSTLQAKYLSDLSRAIDVLGELETVDPTRIGAIGHSLGGQQTIWLMMYDRRVRAGAVSCGVSTYRAVFEDRIVHNYPFYIPNLMLAGDMDLFMQDIAPRPLLLSAGVDDFIFPIRGVRRIDAALSRRYRELGAAEYYRCTTFPGEHDFPAASRGEAYKWLDRHL